MPRTHIHEVQIYYEDTDLSGAVYHANYLKFFERAREHSLGPEYIRALGEREDVWFAVYKAELTYLEPARFADTLEIRSTVEYKPHYQIIFKQDAYRKGNNNPCVRAAITLVVVGGNLKLKEVPATLVEQLRAQGFLE